MLAEDLNGNLNGVHASILAWPENETNDVTHQMQGVGLCDKLSSCMLPIKKFIYLGLSEEVFPSGVLDDRC